MARISASLAWFLASVGLAQPLAADPFSLTFGYDPGIGERGGGSADFSAIGGLFAAFRDSGLMEIDPTYDGIEAVDITADLFGEVVSLTIGQSGSDYVATVAGFGAQESFADPDKDEAIDMAIDFIDDNLPNLTSRFVANTATDHVAGNPASLQTRMALADFDVGTIVGPQPEFRSEGAGGANVASVYSAGVNIGRYEVGNAELSFRELPLTYAMPLDDPRYAIILMAPIAWTAFNGAEAFTVSVGGGVRLPMLDHWTLTPTVRAGIATSDDYSLTGHLFAASLVSNFRHDFGSVDMAIGNQIGISRAIPIDANDYEGLSNTVLKNGIAFSGDTGRRFYGQAVTWDFNLVNTQMGGDDLFIESFTEVAVSLGTQSSVGGMEWDNARLGLTYTFGDQDLSGLKLNFGFQF